MKFIADLHIHSKYSRATSKDMELEGLSRWAKLKGIDLLATGDFTHPFWFAELKKKLRPAEEGLFEYNGVHFILNVEISSIYSKNGRTRKIHNLIFAPSFEIAEKISRELGRIGNLTSDGRPILGLDSEKLAEIVYNVSNYCVIIPAHAWTPWFSIFGSNSGFDSIEECFGKYTRYIFAIETGLSCYDGETEILTEKGWKKISKVLYSDKLCSLNLQNGGIEFQEPARIYTYKYKGKMYRLKTKRVDLLVTPNHKLLYSPCDFRNRKPYSLREAKFLYGKSKRFKKDGVWIGRNPKYFRLPAVKIKHGNKHYSGFRYKGEKQFDMKTWLKFFGFWLAEGWVSKGKKGDYNVCLCSRNKIILDEMGQLLRDLGYRTYQGRHIIRVRDYQLFYYLKQFGKSSDKFVPSDIKSLSKELLEILSACYLKGDGHTYGRNGKGLSATTTSIYLRDDLQEIALKIGISAYYKLDRRKGTIISSMPYKGKVYKQRKDAWVIYFIRQNEPIITPSEMKKHNHTESWVDYDGLVFCVSVPNHVVYIRRNGLPLWCGNSDPAMNWRLSKLDNISLISCSDAHSPQKLGREVCVFDTELNYKSIFSAIRHKDRSKFLFTVEFFPEEGKYHFDGHRNCKVRWSPEETKKHNGLCSVCLRPVTVGVMNRVDKLADRKDGYKPEDAVPFRNLIPLQEIIAEGRGAGVGTKGVETEYLKAVQRFGSEFKVLLDVPEKELKEALDPRVAEGIIRVRKGKVSIAPGFDGEYGTIKIFGEQIGLF